VVFLLSVGPLVAGAVMLLLVMARLLGSALQLLDLVLGLHLAMPFEQGPLVDD
jgi:hypothetical protein